MYPTEILFPGVPADARVEASFLADRARRAPLVVVRRIDPALVGQGEQLLADRPEQQLGVALLEVGAPGAAHEQRIAREHRAMIARHERQATRSVSRRGTHLERFCAELDYVTMRKRLIHVLGLIDPSQRDAAAERRLHQPGAGHVIGVAMRVESEQQAELELADQRLVPRVLLEHRIDQHRGAVPLVREQVGVGTRQLIEELAGRSRSLQDASEAAQEVLGRPANSGVALRGSGPARGRIPPTCFQCSVTGCRTPGNPRTPGPCRRIARTARPRGLHSRILHTYAEAPGRHPAAPAPSASVRASARSGFRS